jgi:hypothetical protein
LRSHHRSGSRPGWYDDSNGEIGDICAWKTLTLGGHTIQLEWSNKAGVCVSCELLLRAKLCTEIFLGSNSRGRVADRRMSASLRGFETSRDEQRIFPGRDIFPAEQVRCFDLEIRKC